MRDLIRSRQMAVDDLRRKRQVISSIMLRQGRTYPGKKTWGAVTARKSPGRALGQTVYRMPYLLHRNHMDAACPFGFSCLPLGRMQWCA
jgi:hypothetical protein